MTYAKLGRWSGTLSALRSRYAVYYGGDHVKKTLIYAQCDDYKACEIRMLLYCKSCKITNELFDVKVLGMFKQFCMDNHNMVIRSLCDPINRNAEMVADSNEINRRCPYCTRQKKLKDDGTLYSRCDDCITNQKRYTAENLRRHQNTVIYNVSLKR